MPGKPIKQAQDESDVTMIKMASNENPFGPSPLALDAIRDLAPAANLYPDIDARELRAELAGRHNLSPEQVLVSDGSTPLLDMLARLFLNPDVNWITSERTFINYPISMGASGARSIRVPLQNDTYDLDAMAAAIDSSTRLIIIANPNNPTGTMVDANAIDAFLNKVPETILVVLDEAYYDFAEYYAASRGMTYSRSLEYARSGRSNVVVLRTFSKIYGLAGIRLGYACGHPQLIQNLARVRPSFSVSILAEAAGLAAIRDQAHVRRTLENNAAGAAWLMERLAELSVRTAPTSANFIYLETAEDADIVAARLQAEGVIIRSLVPWGIPTGLRVTIGTPAQNEKFYQIFQKAIGLQPRLSLAK